MQQDFKEVSLLQSWLLFLYKVPHEPSSYRVSVWRTLKRSGALLLHDAAWALPMSSDNLAQFQKLAEEILKLGGTSLLWEASLAVGKQDDELVRALMVQLEAIIGEVSVAIE
jgi:hypothetical protein